MNVPRYWKAHPRYCWNATTILNRIQAISDTFLAYHGFRGTGTLKVFAQTVDWTAEMPKSFYVQVKITTAKLLTEERENYHPRQQDIQRMEKALSWVLRALLVHADKPPLFRR